MAVAAVGSVAVTVSLVRRRTQPPLEVTGPGGAGASTQGGRRRSTYVDSRYRDHPWRKEPDRPKQHPPAEQEPAPSTSRRTWTLNETCKDLICGAVAEAAQVAALYPMDTLKVRCQLSQLSPVAELRAMMKASGPRTLNALYAGVRPAALGAAVFGGLYMLAYQSLYRRNTKLLGVSEDSECERNLGLLGVAAGISSCMANCVTAVVEVPLDTARQRLQAGVSQGSMVTLLYGQARAGPRVLYNGFFPFLMRTLPQDALQFMLYSQFSALRESHSRKDEEVGPANDNPFTTAVADMFLGGVAGGISALVTMPLDCIKTHINCSPPGQSLGMAAVARQIWVASGPTGFFAGVGPRLMERVPSCAVYWLAAEATRRLLDKATADAAKADAASAAA